MEIFTFIAMRKAEWTCNEFSLVSTTAFVVISYKWLGLSILVTLDQCFTIFFCPAYLCETKPFSKLESHFK